MELSLTTFIVASAKIQALEVCVSSKIFNTTTTNLQNRYTVHTRVKNTCFTYSLSFA